MNVTARRRRYREILDGDRCYHPASVFDPISARIAEDLGFEVGMFAGSIASATALGAPDLIVLTLTEFAQQVHRICRAGDLSLMVDADHGYGNALSVKRTVEELETAGLAALTIEDTRLPQTFGEPEVNALISIEEGVGKMKAALAGRQDPDLAIIGRTSAMQFVGVSEAIERAKAYEGAGVDGIFLVGVTTRAELEAVRAEVSVPLLLGGASAELADLDYLGRTGVRIALQGHQPFQASVKATYDTLKALREGASPADIQPTVASAELMAQVTRRMDYEGWVDEFLR